MATYSKERLSGSTDGKPIKVAATSIGTGTTIHTADASADDFPILYVVNTSVTTVTLTLGWGGTTDPDDLIIVNVEGKAGLILVAAGDVPITNSLVIKAAASVANVLNILGSVNRVT